MVWKCEPEIVCCFLFFSVLNGPKDLFLICCFIVCSQTLLHSYCWFDCKISRLSCFYNFNIKQAIQLVENLLLLNMFEITFWMASHSYLAFFFLQLAILLFHCDLIGSVEIFLQCNKSRYYYPSLFICKCKHLSRNWDVHLNTTWLCIWQYNSPVSKPGQNRDTWFTRKHNLCLGYYAD